MKVFVVKQWTECECDSPCNCVGYTIDEIYFSKSKADKRAKELYYAFVDEYTIHTNIKAKALKAFFKTGEI